MANWRYVKGFFLENLRCWLDIEKRKSYNIKAIQRKKEIRLLNKNIRLNNHKSFVLWFFFDLSSTK